MMADIYADGQLATGLNDGSGWANAHQGAAGLQSALDAAGAGDTIHVTRTFTLSAPLDVDQASGSDGSPIRVLGYSYNGGSPIVDGTKAVIDADSAAANCILIAAESHWLWESLEFLNATGINVAFTGGNAMYHAFVRCDSHGAGSSGFGGSGGSWVSTKWCECRSYDNGADGWSGTSYGCSLVGCQATGNTGNGASLGAGNCAVNGVFCDNGADGVTCLGVSPTLIGNVCDGNGGDGIQITAGAAACYLNRLTNNGGYGLNISTGTVLDRWNFYEGNSSGDVNGSTPHPDDRGASTRLSGGEAGYEDRAGGRFNLRVGAAGWRTEIDLGGGNYVRAPRGLPTMVVPQMGGRN